MANPKIKTNTALPIGPAIPAGKMPAMEANPAPAAVKQTGKMTPPANKTADGKPKAL